MEWYELPNQPRNLSAMIFQREVPGIQQMNACLGHIS